MHILGEDLQSALTVPFSTARLQASIFAPNCTIPEKS